MPDPGFARYDAGMQAPYTLTHPLPTAGEVHVFDSNTLPWQATGNPGLWLKPIRHDDERGHFLGLVKFDAFTRSGLHQHQAVATSFVVDGGLTDYHGSIDLHEAGINVKGSTHDAIAYRPTVLASRLEGPVIYPPKSDISGVHAGSTYAEFRNPDPDVPPEINVPVDVLELADTGIPGVKRQTIFDYANTGTERRMVQLTIRPHTEFAFEATALTELWLRGGNLEANGKPVHANGFVVCEPGAKVQVSSPFGALVIAWAEGREKSAGNLFGF
jgi:hypothetical protein